MVQVIDRAPTIAQTLGGLLGGGLGGFAGGVGQGLQQNIANFYEQQKEVQKEQKILDQIEDLKTQGFSDQEARLYSLLTTGGQTELSKAVIDRIVRGGESGWGADPIEDPEEPIGEPPGMTAAERFRRRERIGKEQFELTKPLFQRATQRAEQNQQKRIALRGMERAQQEGNFGFLSPDNLAEMTGIEALRTPQGANFISAGKEYFLGSLQRAGARPNQWIEQQIGKMLPRIGRSPLANLSVIEALKTELAIENEFQNILDRLSAEDEKKHGYVKRNIGQRVDRELEKFADEQQDFLEKRLRALQKNAENGKDPEILKPLNKVPKGTQLTQEKAREILERAKGDRNEARKEARQLGYDF